MPLKINDASTAGISQLNRWADEKEAHITEHSTLIKKLQAQIVELSKKVKN